MKATRRRPVTFLVLALACPAGAQTPAAAETALVELDQSEYEIPPAVAGHATIAIPLRVRAEGVTAAAHPLQVLLGPRPLRADTTIVSASAVEGGRRILTVKLDPATFAGEGRYVVRLGFASGTPPAAEAFQSVPLTLIRPPATVASIPGTLTVERTVYFPCLWACTSPRTLRPDRILLRETGGKTPLDFPAAEIPVRVVLSRPDQTTESGVLTIGLPPRIESRQSATVRIKTDGAIGLGTVSGIATITSPQLAQGSADIQVQLNSRLCHGWLLAAIFAGIGFGKLARDQWEIGLARTEGLIAVETQRERLLEAKAATPDPDLKAALEQFLFRLGQAIATPQATSTTLTEAAEEVRKAFDDLMEKRTALRARLGNELRTWRRACAAEPVPAPLKAAMTELRSEVEGALSALEQDYVSEAERMAGTFAAGPADTVHRALARWLATVAALRDVGAWADVEAASLAMTAADAAAAAAATAGQPVTPQSFETELLAARRLIQYQLRPLAADAIPGMASLAREILDDVRMVRRMPAGSAARVLDAADALEASAAALEAGLPDGFGVAAKTLRAALVDMIQTGAGELGAVKADLDEGRLRAAAARLRALATTDPLLGAGDEAAPADDGFPTGRTGAPASPAVQVAPVPIPAVTVTLPTDIAVGERVAAEIRWVSAAQDASSVAFRWQVTGMLPYQGAPGERVCSFVPAAAGPITVEVTGNDPRSGQRIDAHATGMVVKARGAAALAQLEPERKRLRRLIYGLSTGIVVATGYAIFAPTFVGSSYELLGAFLWGFTADVGLAQARAYADPFKRLSLKAPA